MTDFAFPAIGDLIAICEAGYQGRRFAVRDVREHRGRAYVTVYDPCPVPGCADHSPWSAFPATSCRPWLSA